MIEPMSWRRRAWDERNPFIRGEKRPLKVTLHTSSFVDISREQRLALELLDELRTLDDLDVIDTVPGPVPYIEIGPFDEGQDDFPVQLRNGDDVLCYTHVSPGKQELTTALALSGARALEEPRAAEALRDTLVCRAHVRLDRDLLITESRCIFDGRERNIVRPANPRRILEALRIIGLLLRVRERYVYGVPKRRSLAPGEFGRDLFYWVLTRQRTPNMWKYHSACVAAESVRGDDTPALGGSVLTRCKRAIQARDRVAESFYAPQGGHTRDELMYHFDYLTLLLVGALDAQARVAHRAYGISGHERDAHLRRRSFRDKVARAGAGGLCALLSEARSEALLAFLHGVRNTIHGAGLRSHTYAPVGSEWARIEVEDPGLATALWSTASALGGPEEWGLAKERHRRGAEGPIVERFFLEPHTCAEVLVRECLALVDKIAAVTDVDRLVGGQARPLREQPPEDHVFGAAIRERLALLA